MFSKKATKIDFVKFFGLLRKHELYKEEDAIEVQINTILLTIGGLMMIMRLDWADQVAIEACKKASIFFLLVSFLQYSCCTVKRTLSCENPAKACVRNYRYIRYAYIQNLLF